LILINLLVLTQVIYNLFLPFDYLSSYSLRLLFAIVSTFSILSALIKKMDSERFFILFIFITLIISPCLIIFEFLKDLMIHGISRTDLIDNPVLLVKLIIGIVLIYFSIKYSNISHEDRVVNYNILIMLIGLYIIILTGIMHFESRLYSGLYNKPVWISILKLFSGFMITFVGYRLMNEKIKTRKGLVYVLIFLIINGLV
jgi:hypothetical protein